MVLFFSRLPPTFMWYPTWRSVFFPHRAGNLRSPSWVENRMAVFFFWTSFFFFPRMLELVRTFLIKLPGAKERITKYNKERMWLKGSAGAEDLRKVSSYPSKPVWVSRSFSPLQSLIPAFFDRVSTLKVRFNSAFRHCFCIHGKKNVFAREWEEISLCVRRRPLWILQYVTDSLLSSLQSRLSRVCNPRFFTRSSCRFWNWCVLYGLLVVFWAKLTCIFLLAGSNRLARHETAEH